MPRLVITNTAIRFTTARIGPTTSFSRLLIAEANFSNADGSLVAVGVGELRMVEVGDGEAAAVGDGAVNRFIVNIGIRVNPNPEISMRKAKTKKTKMNRKMRTFIVLYALSIISAWLFSNNVFA